MIDQEKLIPEIRDWRASNGQEFDIENWIAIEGNIKLAIGYTLIFWPDFFEHDGCVFLKSHFSLDSYNQWKKVDYIENYAQIEYVINHIHILDLFTDEKHSGISYVQVKYLGTVLRDIYETKLKALFPDKKFAVTFNGEEIHQDLIDYELAFFQESNEIRKTKNDS